MSTANFITMKNFPLYTIDFYNDGYRCRDCGYVTEDAGPCPCCGSEDMEEGTWYDEGEAEIACDDIRSELDEINEDLMFHKITLESGYFSGYQLYVEERFNPEDMDNDECNYEFNMCRSISRRKFKSEVNKINRELKRIGEWYGFEHLVCLGRFSNGEAVYKTA